MQINSDGQIVANKIDLIKMVRQVSLEYTSNVMDLREAKDFIEFYLYIESNQEVKRAFETLRSVVRAESATGTGKIRVEQMLGYLRK